MSTTCLSSAAIRSPKSRVSVFLRFRLGDFFLPHQGADFFGNSIAFGFEVFNMSERFTQQFISMKNSINETSSPAPRVARR